MAATDARPVPRKNAAYRFYFAIRKNDGTLITTWAGADSEVSIDGAAFADCTNEATEIGTTGCGYIDFTASEMNGDAVVYKLTVTNTGALPVVVTFFPDEVGDYRCDVVQISGDTTAADNAELAFDGTGYNVGAGSIVAASVTGAVGSVTGNIGGNLSGNVTGSVGSVAAGGITAASIATGAIDADALATDAVEEIRNAITGGAYALSTDANGRIRIVDGTAAGEIDTSSGLLGLTTAAINAIADQMWDEALSGHLTAGSTGNALNAAGSAGDPWSTSLPGAYGAGSAGYIVGTYLDAAISGRATNAGVWANGTRTLSALGFTLGASDLASDTITDAKIATSAIEEIRNAITGGAYALSTDANGRVRIVDGTAAGELDTSSGHVTLADGSLVTAKLGTFVLAKTTNITGFNDLSAANVNAEVVDAIATDTYAEPSQGAPGATISLSAKIGWLYTAFRNKKTSDASEVKLFADDGTTVLAKSPHTDDGTTHTQSEFATGA